MRIKNIHTKVLISILIIAGFLIPIQIENASASQNIELWASGAPTATAGEDKLMYFRVFDTSLVGRFVSIKQYFGHYYETLVTTYVYAAYTAIPVYVPIPDTSGTITLQAWESTYWNSYSNYRTIIVTQPPPPVLTIFNIATAYEDSIVSFTVTLDNIDGEILYLEEYTGTSWLVRNVRTPASDGIYDIPHIFDTPGIKQMRARVEFGSQEKIEETTIEILPTITITHIASAFEDSIVSFTVTLDNIDGEILYLEEYTGTSWLVRNMITPASDGIYDIPHIFDFPGIKQMRARVEFGSQEKIEETTIEILAVMSLSVIGPVHARESFQLDVTLNTVINPNVILYTDSTELPSQLITLNPGTSVTSIDLYFEQIDPVVLYIEYEWEGGMINSELLTIYLVEPTTEEVNVTLLSKPAEFDKGDGLHAKIEVQNIGKSTTFLLEFSLTSTLYSDYTDVQVGIDEFQLNYNLNYSFFLDDILNDLRDSFFTEYTSTKEYALNTGFYDLKIIVTANSDPAYSQEFIKQIEIVNPNNVIFTYVMYEQGYVDYLETDAETIMINTFQNPAATLYDVKDYQDVNYFVGAYSVAELFGVNYKFHTKVWTHTQSYSGSAEHLDGISTIVGTNDIEKTLNSYKDGGLHQDAKDSIGLATNWNNEQYSYFASSNCWKSSIYPGCGDTSRDTADFINYGGWLGTNKNNHGFDTIFGLYASGNGGGLAQLDGNKAVAGYLQEGSYGNVDINNRADARKYARLLIIHETGHTYGPGDLNSTIVPNGYILQSGTYGDRYNDVTPVFTWYKNSYITISLRIFKFQ